MWRRGSSMPSRSMLRLRPLIIRGRKIALHGRAIDCVPPDSASCTDNASRSGLHRGSERRHRHCWSAYGPCWMQVYVYPAPRARDAEIHVRVPLTPGTAERRVPRRRPSVPRRSASCASSTSRTRPSQHIKVARDVATVAFSRAGSSPLQRVAVLGRSRRASHPCSHPPRRADAPW